ncbi:NnrS family protein [Azospirillum sp.]|uniref:NnrS family protein n=1 Tax=Azospirillum sp. TaxID=34012 RepID=UPI002D25B46A|nr:NnrS family protein [Azospirillum sp.]HYD64909.1 NnrS family protein [Azospirillum sp.]
MTLVFPDAARRMGGHRVFFPLALAFAVLGVPYWTAGYLGWLPVAWTPAVHAHEMVMGFALAVVGGFLLTKPTRPVLALAAGAWLLGRAAMLAGLPPTWAVPATLAYPVVLFVHGGLPFLRAAKSGHNAVFGPLIGAFAAAEALVWAGGDGGRAGALLALHLVGLLLFTMGGRIIPSATAGAVRQQGGVLVARVQPRLEWLGVGGAITAMLSVATGWLPEAGAAGGMLTGVCALARLARWRTDATLGRPDLWSLHLGYAWLGLGWIAAGVERVAPLPGGAGWHLLGAAALGTIAASMMVRVSLQREAWAADFPPAATLAVVLIGAAAVLRVAAGWAAPAWLMPAAAVAWTVAHLLILGAVARILRRPRRKAH